jgi:hypothetical protein
MNQKSNEIPFSAMVPTTEGAYWWKSHEDGYPMIRELKTNSKGLCVFMGDCHGFLASKIEGLWSPPLIPSTELEEGKNKFKELQSNYARDLIEFREKSLELAITKTTLDRLKKRVEELEHCLRQLFYWRLPFGTKLEEEISEKDSDLWNRTHELLVT